MRARNIKPGFFENELLVELPIEARFLFIGMWCMADREGRLEDRPKKIKLQVMPYDSVEVELLLEKLQDSGFILRYSVNGAKFISINNFLKHQRPHPNETPSIIPPPETITAEQIDIAEALLSEVITEEDCGFSVDDAREILRKAALYKMEHQGVKDVSPCSTKVLRTRSDSLNPDSLNQEKKEISRFSTAETATPPEPNIPAAAAADLDPIETLPGKTGKRAGNGKAKRGNTAHRQANGKAKRGQGEDVKRGGSEQLGPGKEQQDTAWHGNGPATLRHGSAALCEGLVQHGSAAQRPASKGAEGEGDERGPPGVSFITRSKRKLNGWKAEAFGRFWDTFNLKHGRAEAADAWLNIAGLDAETAEAIIRAAGREARDRPGLLADGGKPKWAQGWLTGRRWEDEALTVEGAAAQRPESWAERKAREMAEKGML